MSNYVSYQNGLCFDQIPPVQCQNVLNLSTHQNLKKPFRCHICYFLFFFQIISTFLMLISLSFTFELISAEEFSAKLLSESITTHSGNTVADTTIENPFEEIFYRFRRLSENKTWILTKDSAKYICSDSYYADRFKSLKKLRLANCGMFDINTIIYPFLINVADIVNVTSNINFPTYPSSVRVTDDIISKLPSQLLTLTNTGEIRASLKSTQTLILEHFSRTNDCINVLSKIIDIDDNIREEVSNFRETLLKNNCYVTGKPNRLKTFISCDRCETAYKDWLCTQYFDMFTSIILPNSKLTKNHTNDTGILSALIGIKSCPSWCSRVETDCVYFTPATGNGGEPAFLCDESHYHQNARYKMNVSEDCGEDLPWKFCCYSQSLLDKWQNRRLEDGNQSSVCVTKQEKCLMKLIEAIYQAKWWFSSSSSPSSSSESLNKSVYVSNSNHSPPPLFSRRHQVTVAAIISCWFLYFYTDFPIR